MPTLFNQITFIGIGLIGSSLARVIKEHNLTEKLVAYDSNHNNTQKALELGVIDESFDDITKSVQNADLIMICTRITSYNVCYTKLLRYLE